MKAITRDRLALGFILILSACASDSALHSDNPEVIYSKGVSLMEKGRYIEATEHLNEVKRRFPQSRFAILADLRRADVEFRQENFTEAAAVYSTFVDLYPNHELADYAQIRQAEAHMEDTPANISRDQAPAEKAAQAAKQLLVRYPKSTYLPKANQIYNKARSHLAEKEAYIARFYERRHAEWAAKQRWKNIIEDFTDIKDNELSKGLYMEAEQRIAALKGVKAPSELEAQKGN